MTSFETGIMKTMISYSKHIALVLFALLFSCALKAQTKSSITPLDYCYEGELVEFTYNFKKADIDSVSFVITFFNEGNPIDKRITFKKNVEERIVLRKLGNKVRIKYLDRGKEKSKEVNLLNHQKEGKSPTKKEHEK